MSLLLLKQFSDRKYIADLLLKNGANLETKDHDGMTPIFLAVNHSK